MRRHYKKSDAVRDQKLREMGTELEHRIATNVLNGTWRVVTPEQETQLTIRQDQWWNR